MRSLRGIYLIFSAAVVLLIQAGCSTGGSLYYDSSVPVESSGAESAEIKHIGGNLTPVIFIHGLLGSELWDKTSEPARRHWGDFSYWSMLGDAFSDRLALPLGNADSKTLLQPGAIMSKSKASVLGISFELDHYSSVLNILNAMGYNTSDNTLFVFAYDWRKSIAENAAELSAFVDEKHSLFKSIARQSGRSAQEMRFDLIGHSMGGLLARYYVQYGNAPMGCRKSKLPAVNWAGAAKVRKVVMIASPNSGYADTLLEISGGLELFAMAPAIPGCVLATFPSYYQMLPGSELKAVRLSGSEQVIDIFDIANWKKYRWGLLAEDARTRRFLEKMLPGCSEEQRRNAALEYTARCLESASRFKLLMNRPAGLPPEGVRFYSFASAEIPASAGLDVDPESGKVSLRSKEVGDGKVTLHSAHPGHGSKAAPLFMHGTITLNGGHLGLMHGTLFARNLFHLLQCSTD